MGLGEGDAPGAGGAPSGRAVVPGAAAVAARRGPHGKTYEERKRRVGALQALAVEFGLSVAEQNLFDEAEARTMVAPEL